MCPLTPVFGLVSFFSLFGGFMLKPVFFVLVTVLTIIGCEVLFRLGQQFARFLGGF